MNTINQSKFTRQGDVILIPITKLPEGLQKVESEAKILQDSETQGKFHHFKPDSKVTIYQKEEAASDVTTITPDFGKFIVVDEDTILYHGRGFHAAPNEGTVTDHHALTIKPGTYMIGIQQVYDKERKQPRKNVD